MTKGGLYIPMPEHIKIFCTTYRYSQCHQYIRGKELLKETAQQLGYVHEDGRRRYRRILDRFSVSISLCDESGNPVEILDENANTVDVSLGGIRLISRTELPKNKMIAFTFGPDFSIPGFADIAEIKWCEALPDEPQKYQSGLAFLKANSRQAIGNHLGLPM